MLLLKTIDGLFAGTRYGVWVLSVLGLAGSIILTFVNLSVGAAAFFICIASFLLSMALTLGLLPSALVKNDFLKKKRFLAAGIALSLAIVITGIAYFTQGGFPDMNLLFM